MSQPIQRYSATGLDADPNGESVLYVDHLSALSAARAKDAEVMGECRKRDLCECHTNPCQCGADDLYIRLDARLAEPGEGREHRGGRRGASSTPAP